MNQACASRICENYQSPTGIRCTAVFMQKGDNHTPSKLFLYQFYFNNSGNFLLKLFNLGIDTDLT